MVFSEREFLLRKSGKTDTPSRRRLKWNEIIPLNVLVVPHFSHVMHISFVTLNSTRISGFGISYTVLGLNDRIRSKII